MPSEIRLCQPACDHTMCDGLIERWRDAATQCAYFGGDGELRPPMAAATRWMRINVQWQMESEAFERTATAAAAAPGGNGGSRCLCDATAFLAIW